MNVILCGPPFSGKSTVGKKLAQRLNHSFVDTDELLELKTGMNKSDFYRKVGEQEYRQFEQETLDSLSHCTNSVIALGGGVTSINLTDFGSIFYLSVPIKILWKRLNQSEYQPAYLASDQSFEYFSQRISSRLARYQALADHIIPADGPVNEIVERIGGYYGIE